MKSAVLVGLAILWQVLSVHGCSCLPTTLEKTYFSSSTDRYVQAVPVSEYDNDEEEKVYVFTVSKVYKGCKLKRFAAKTAISSATCGITLQIGTAYIIPLPYSLIPFPYLNSCQVSFSFCSRYTCLELDRKLIALSIVLTKTFHFLRFCFVLFLAVHSALFIFVRIGHLIFAKSKRLLQK